jgi:hypothetical protein
VARHLAHQPVTARGPTPGYVLARFVRRHRVAVVAGTLAALGVLVAGAISAWSLLAATRARDAARRTAYAMTIASAQAAAEAGETGVLRRLLATTAVDQRGFEWQFLMARTEHAARVLPFAGRRPTTVAEAGGRIGTYESTTRQWVVCDARTGAVLGRKAWPWHIEASAPTPDGTTLVVGGRDGRVARLTPDLLVIAAECRVDGGDVRGLAFGGDERRLVVGTVAGMRLVDASLGASHGRELARCTTLDGELRRLDVALQAPIAAWCESVRHAALWDLTTGAVSARFEHPAPVRAIALHPAATSLATAGRDRVLRLWDVATGRVRAEQVTRELPECLAWSHDGRTLVSGHENGSVRWWDAATLRDLGVGRGHDALVAAIRTRADGTALTTAWDGTHRIWSEPPAQDRVRLQGMFGTTRFVRAHPTAPRVFATSLAGEVACWDLPALHRVWRRKLLAGMCEGLAVAADGQTLWVADEAGHVTAMATADGTVLRQARPTGSVVPRQLCRRDDGTLLASLGDGSLAIVSVPDLALVRRLPLATGARRGMPFDLLLHPGDALASVCMPTCGVRTFALATGAIAWERLDLRSATGAFCPQRGTLCLVDEHGTLVDLDSRTGRTLRELRSAGLEQGAATLQFTADGRRLLVAARRNVVLDPRDGLELLRFDNDRYESGALLLLEGRGWLLTGGGNFADEAELLAWPLAEAAR